MARSVTLYALGISHPPAIRSWYTHMFLTVDGRDIIIDCPAYLDKMIAENNAGGGRQVALSDYRELVVTHLHADHAGGLEEIAYLNVFDVGPTPRLYSPQWMLDDIWNHTLHPVNRSYRGDGGNASLDWFFEPIPIGNPHDMGGGITLSTKETRHIPRTLALKFDLGNYKFGYSADTAFDPSLIEWLSDCDTVVHEVFLVDSPHPRVRDMHTLPEDLLALPEEFQRRTFLAHYADNYTEWGQLGHYRYLEQGRVYDLL